MAVFGSMQRRAKLITNSCGDHRMTNVQWARISKYFVDYRVINCPTGAKKHRMTGPKETS
uniref:Uncharacterized protein n=1 Tax=Leersia perrieri TaxID=77586 RepID=A0A0D9X0Y0_9ORYZ